MKKRKITFKQNGNNSDHIIIKAEDYNELIEQLGKFLFIDEIIRIERFAKI